MTIRWPIVLLLAAVAVATLSATAWAQGGAFDRFGDNAPRVGETAPDIEAVCDDGTEFVLSELCDVRPVLILFGSCT